MGDTNELKPCPFCGGKGNASERTCDKDSRYNPNDRAYPVVRCSVCFTTVGGKDWSGISTAIEAWNKRATATPPADAALADSIDSLGFVISGDNPPVKEWVSECGGGCMPATKEEKMMWDVLQSALRARAVPDAVALNDARWRALIGCKRIRLIGCSGVHPDGTLMADRDGHVHFGAEFWTHHDSESSQVSINVITAFADAMLAASKEDGK